MTHDADGGSSLGLIPSGTVNQITWCVYSFFAFDGSSYSEPEDGPSLWSCSPAEPSMGPLRPKPSGSCSNDQSDSRGGGGQHSPRFVLVLAWHPWDPGPGYASIPGLPSVVWGHGDRARSTGLTSPWIAHLETSRFLVPATSQSARSLQRRQSLLQELHRRNYPRASLSVLLSSSLPVTIQTYTHRTVTLQA